MTSVNLTDISAQDSEDPDGWNYKTIYFIEAVLILGAIITLGCIVVFVTFLNKLKYILKIILISLLGWPKIQQGLKCHVPYPKSNANPLVNIRKPKNISLG